MISRLGLPGLCGITMGLGLAMLGQSGTTAQAFNPQTVQCYGPIAAPVTAVATHQSTIIDRADTAQISATLTPVTQSALSAVQACSQGQCTGAQASAMKRTVATYLVARSRVTTDLFRQQGAKGLSAATQLSAETHDAELSKALAALYASGRLDISEFGTERDALALVVLKPTTAFRPCESLYRTVRVQGYVY